MEQNNQPSPYFIRRTARPENQPIEIRDFSVVEDQVHPLRDYWLLVKRHSWLILSCALVMFISAALYTFTRTPLYTAEATILIERKTPQILKLQDAREESFDEDYFYKTQYEILKSRSLAERVVRDEGLENHPVFGGGKPEQPEKRALVSGLWQQLKDSVTARTPKTQDPQVPAPDPIPVATRLAGGYLSMLQVRPTAGTSLVEIKFTTPDPALSARLANAHAASYVRYGIDLRAQSNSEASEFLQQKLTELKERVEQSEAALNSYRKEKGIISVDDKSNVIIERLLDLNKGLTAAEGERIAWEAQVRAIRGRSADEIPSVRNSVMIGALKGELTKYEAEYASLAKEFKPGYPPLDIAKARVDETRRRLSSEIDKEVRGIEAGFATARNKETELRATMEQQKKATLSLKDSAVQYAILAREVDTNKQLYDGVLQRLKEIGVTAQERTSNIYLLGKALQPDSPSYPDKQRTMMLGLLLGLAVGTGLAFLLEQLDNTLKTSDEAERYLRLPTLATVPDFASVNGTTTGYVSRLVKSAQAELPVSGRNGSKHSESQVLLDHHPLSIIAEAYKSFRSALLLSQAGGPPHTVLVTSAARGEGKTTTLVNTAIVFAQLGIRVLIIDGDLRRPNCHRLLRMENSAGLSDLLAGQIETDAAIRPTSAENLFFISAGALPPNPAELLGSNKMHDLLEQLRSQFEFIFVDSSPLLAVSDAVFLSTMVDGTLLVVNRRTPKPLVRKARARLTVSQTKILGMLLNRIDVHNNEYGGYYQQYHEYYAEDPRSLTDKSRSALQNGNGESHQDSGLNGSASGSSDPVINGKSPNGHTAGVMDVVRAKLAATIAPIADRARREPVVPQHAVQEIESLAEPPADSPQKPAMVPPEPAETQINGKPPHPSSEKKVGTSSPAKIQKRPERLPAEFLQFVGEKLWEAMGPMASLVLNDHIRALGESPESFPTARLEELVNRVSKEIFTDSFRRRFEEQMKKKVETIDQQHV